MSLGCEPNNLAIANRVDTFLSLLSCIDEKSGNLFFFMTAAFVADKSIPSQWTCERNVHTPS